MRYATGRYMRHDELRHAFEVEDVAGIVRTTLRRPRASSTTATQELAPGIKLHLFGGHTMGLQCVRVETARGAVVLASDATHFYENLETERPLHHRLPRRRHDGGLRQAAAARAARPSTSSPGTTRW